jgi:cleavage and polyadenylation specificity factor subunit 1
MGIRHFRYMLEGRLFTIYTDHKPLTFALQKVADPWTARQARHLSYVAEFSTDIRHVAGVENVVADTMSRPPTPAAGGSGRAVPQGPPPLGYSEPCVAASLAVQVPASPGYLDMAVLAAAQRTCPAVAAAKNSSLKLELVSFNEVRVLCETSLPQPRPFIPLSHRRQFFEAVHGLAHPGMRATRRLLAARGVWQGMNKDVNAWCRDCQHCARAKVHKQPAAAVVAIPVPQQRFAHVHLDIVGPLPTSVSGERFVLTMIDRTTRWLEAVPLSSIEAATCAEAFISSWVARFGVPAQLTSDQGRQFTSAVWARVCQLLGVLHVTTTAYHPQSNGMVERVHRQLKDALRARLAASDWPQHLPWVLLGLRAAPKEDSGVSSAEMLYGSPLTLPGQFLAADEPPIAELLRQLRSSGPLPTRPLSTPPPTSPPAALQSSPYVYVRRLAASGPLAPQYAGPYKVVDRHPKFFKLQMGDRVECVSVDRLKPHLGTAAVSPAQPPRLGRPPEAEGAQLPSSSTSFPGQVDGRSYAAVTRGGTVEAS